MSTLIKNMVEEPTKTHDSFCSGDMRQALFHQLCALPVNSSQNYCWQPPTHTAPEQDSGTDEEIPLPNVKTAILSKVHREHGGRVTLFAFPLLLKSGSRSSTTASTTRTTRRKRSRSR